MIAFPCPKCHFTLKAPEEKVGARTKCPKCGCPVQVPGHPASAPPAVAEVSVPARAGAMQPFIANEEAHSVNQPATKYCYACAASINARAEICPKCGVRQHRVLAQAAPADPDVRQASGTKMAAGLCGILVGGLGIHKFILGLTTPGVIMLLVSLLTCGIGILPMAVIGLVEGIIYLSKSDEDFYETYVVGKRQWF